MRAGAFAGFNGATFTQSPSAAALFPVFAPWEERLPHGLTAERIVDGESFAAAPETVAIPGFLVEAVVEAPGGAWPFSCTPGYSYDAEYLERWVRVARDPDAARAFIAAYVLGGVGAPA